MNTCNKCKKEKDIQQFISNNKQLKTCFNCREQCRKWRETNKDVVSLYNKTYNENNSEKTEQTFVYAKKSDSDEWIKFPSQLEAAKQLGLYATNINKVINGSLKTTGGYIFKVQIEEYKTEKKDWTEVKEENNIIDKCKGQPSNHRTLHETIDGIIGKKCCKCKHWKSLTDYNYSESHWDKLRVDCKDCLIKWRKENREKLQQINTNYEKHRKLTDPEFKLVKTLRSRLGTAVRRQNSNKNNTTIELLGCSVSFLKGYLEAKFTEGMTWENHGEWHIDHIKPCASFNLLDEEEQKKCFHYTNLQPLWAADNLSKGCKYIDDNMI
jgi:hypothetical protein